MQPRQDAAYAGVFRSTYFLSVTAAAIFIVLTSIFALYSRPSGDSILPNGSQNNGFFNDVTVQSSSQSEEKSEKYNRNVSIILTLVSAGVFAVGVLGLGGRFNPLRAGLALGALLLFLTGMGFWANSSDEWIGILTSGTVLAVLLVGAIALDDGFPLSPRTPPRRLDPSDIAPPATVPDIASPVPTEPPPMQPPQTPL